MYFSPISEHLEESSVPRKSASWSLWLWPFCNGSTSDMKAMRADDWLGAMGTDDWLRVLARMPIWRGWKVPRYELGLNQAHYQGNLEAPLW